MASSRTPRPRRSDILEVSAGWHVTRRNLKIALAIVLAFVANARRLPDTLAARRRVAGGARHDHRALLARFTTS